jgi:hypothetical protein
MADKIDYDGGKLITPDRMDGALPAPKGVKIPEKLPCGGGYGGVIYADGKPLAKCAAGHLFELHKEADPSYKGRLR